MIKTAQTIKKGDVFRTEYGDYGNFVNFEFISCEADKNNWTKITVKSTFTGEVLDVFENNPIDKVTFDVVKKCEGEEE